MKTKLLLISSLLIVSQLEMYAQEPQKAPVNPAFLNYFKNGYNLNGGAMPSTTLPVKTDPKTLKTRAVNTLPAKYDMRTLGLVTSIKDQLSKGPCGSCWTHSCMANLESMNLKLDNVSFDFSEDNLNNCHSPFDNAPCAGGSFYMSSAYLLGAKGPLLESQDPYMGPTDNTCPSTTIDPAEYITDAWMVPTNDNNLIKQTIMTYGSLDASFYYTFKAIRTSDSTFFFNQPYTFNTPSGSIDTSGFGQWHEISIIGWDDNKATTASLPGAWIVKNSIVKTAFNDPGQGGAFLYVSYYDSVAWQSIGLWPKKIPYNSAAQFHHYDEGGWVSSYGYNDNNADYAIVKFVGSFDQKLKMLTTVAVHPNMTITMDVYDTFNGTTLSGLLGSTGPQTCTYAGYNSFNLSTPITILNGNDFYIKVKYNCPTDYSYLVPIEEAYSGYTTNTPIETGKCWVSGAGTSWYAMGAGTGAPYDVCIKAYAEPTSTGVNEITAATLVNKLYPNPATNMLNIEMKDNSNKTITFKNVQGQIILTKQVNTENTSIDVSMLPAGVYFISIQSENAVENLKFIRQE